MLSARLDDDDRDSSGIGAVDSGEREGRETVRWGREERRGRARAGAGNDVRVGEIIVVGGLLRVSSARIVGKRESRGR